MNMELLKIKKNNKDGFSLVEIVISIGLFGVLVSFLMTALIQNNRQEDYAVYKRQAIFLAEEGTEALRNIRDADYANLVAGTYGISENGSEWGLSGLSDQTDNFTRIITITDVDDDRRDISVDVGWDDLSVQNGTVTVATRLTNWMVASAGGGNLCVDQSTAAFLDPSSASYTAGNKVLNNIYISNIDPACDIEVDKVTLSWTKSSDMTKITLDNVSIWTGTVASGVQADMTNTLLTNAEGALKFQFRFSGKMNGDTFDVTLEFSDGTTVTETNIIP